MQSTDIFGIWIDSNKNIFWSTSAFSQLLSIYERKVETCKNKSETRSGNVRCCCFHHLPAKSLMRKSLNGWWPVMFNHEEGTNPLVRDERLGYWWKKLLRPTIEDKQWKLMMDLMSWDDLLRFNNGLSGQKNCHDGDCYYLKPWMVENIQTENVCEPQSFSSTAREKQLGLELLGLMVLRTIGRQITVFGSTLVINHFVRGILGNVFASLC